MQLLLNARARYADISLTADNPQVQALVRMLRKLREAHVPALIFYATERPDVIDSISDAATHRRRLGLIAGFIEQNRGSEQVYIGPLESLKNEDFIDHVHVLPEGYRKYADSIAPRLSALLVTATARRR
jgi:hypothetical protein